MSTADNKKTLMVISAHAADFVWRAGGTIAKYIKAGHRVCLIVLSYGIRGECNDLWGKPDQTVETVKAIRDRESRAAAELLGVTDPEYWDWSDYPIMVNQERLDRLTLRIRQVRPDIILTHDRYDLMNPDHNVVSDLAFRCSVMSNSAGVRIEGTTATKQMSIYGFEPHQTELSNYKPTMFIDITETYDQKIQAMKCFESQAHLIEYYTQRAFMRGNHARRATGRKDIRYAESFTHFLPCVGDEFV